MVSEQAHSRSGRLQATPAQFVGEGQEAILLTPDASQRLQRLTEQTPVVIVSDLCANLTKDERQHTAEELYPVDREFRNRATGRRVRTVARARGKLAFHSASLRTLQIMPYLKELVENAVPLYENTGKGKHWRNYGVAAVINSEPCFVRLVVYENVHGYPALDILYDAQVTPRKTVEEPTALSRSSLTNGDAQGRGPSKDKLMRWWWLVKAAES